MAHLRITLLHPSLGAEVAGVDLSAPIDEPTRHTLTRALADHLALVFHDQSLTPAQYLAAASVFGPPMGPADADALIIQGIARRAA
jgi:taurine dioxygenase